MQAYRYTYSVSISYCFHFLLFESKLNVKNFVTKSFRFRSFLHYHWTDRTEKVLLIKFEILGPDVSHFFQQRPRAGSQTAIIRGSQQYIGGIKVGAH